MSARICTECGEVHLAGANGAIYCCGALLRAVQMAGVFKDSKHFVDMSSKYSPERTLADYQLFSSCKRNESSPKHLANFVDNHFEQPGVEIDCWCPPEWRREPEFLSQIKDPQLRQFASDLNGIWKKLGRVMKDSVRTNPLVYSLVFLPNPVIVPGGRFTEFYYWDTYWIVRGLLYSGMYQTARGMIDNLLMLVHQYKFVPNGGRIYYWGRSQPPLLVPMVKSYVEITKDDRYALKVLPLLEIETDNFLKNHAVQVQGRTMYQYRDKSAGPRPEAYREDVASASTFSTDEEKEEHYSHLKAACESGMDFSSRWFVSPSGNNVGTLTNIKTTWIVPVDLNCILFRNCKTLAEFNSMSGNTPRADHYRKIACGLIKAITAVLWNEQKGVWLDYDLRNNRPRPYFVVTNLSPLWARAYPINDADKITASVMRYIEENKLDTYPGGVPVTTSNTGQKWDYPNVWPPMMHILIEGLNNLGTPEAKEMSKRWRERWVRSNYEAYSKSGFMFEKYNCEEFGAAGFGGEYDTQTGFGWTNGVMIELLVRYGQELRLTDDVAAEECECACEEEEKPLSALEECPITSEAYLEKKGIPVDCSMIESMRSGGVNDPCSVVCCTTVYDTQSEKEMPSVATSEVQCQSQKSQQSEFKQADCECSDEFVDESCTEYPNESDMTLGSRCCEDCEPPKTQLFPLASTMTENLPHAKSNVTYKSTKSDKSKCQVDVQPSEQRTYMTDCPVASTTETTRDPECPDCSDNLNDCENEPDPIETPIKNKVFPLSDAVSAKPAESELDDCKCQRSSSRPKSPVKECN